MTTTLAPAPVQLRPWQRPLLGLLCALALLPTAAPTHAQPDQSAPQRFRVMPTPQANGQGMQSHLQPPRILTWQTPAAATPIELRRLDVQATIVGRTAATRIELELFNPNGRVLEAQLQFPLAEGQSVTGFALDIDGELRPAVPVEKAKGRQVFEDITRARVDPALLESVGGNHHRLRVYPLPANGSRRVVLELAEVLPNAAAPVWRLPLGLQAPATRLDVSVRVAGMAPGSVSAQLGTLRMPARAEGADTRIALVGAQNSRGEELRVQLPATPQVAQPMTATQRFDGASYFYAEVPVAARSAERVRPERVGLVWDASGSGAGRDHGREFALLNAWLRRLGTVEVLLQPVRDVAGPVERFAVQGGNWSALRDRLKGMAYDGATQAAALRAPEGVQMALVFSDGLGNWGTANDATALPAQPVPTYAVGAIAGSNAAALRRMAEASGGTYLDLLALTNAQALEALAQQAPRVEVTASEGADDVELASALPEQGRIALAGRFTGPEAVVTLQWTLPGGRSETRSLRIKAPAADDAPADLATGVAAHRWAALRMARLESEGERQRAAVRRLGQAFRIASRETSLIVLDTVQDYARHDIEPPPALRARWAQLRTDTAGREAATRAQHLDRIARQFDEKQAWWDKDFPKDDAPPKAKALEQARGGAVAMSAAPPPPSPAPMAKREDSAAAPRNSPIAPTGARGLAREATPSAPGADALAAAPGRAAAAPTASIQLRAWQPDAPYLRRLRAAGSVEDLEAIYLDERPSHTNSTAFFLDVADLLYERGHGALARRVLSNLAEMELENRHVLRILAYRLLQAGDTATALPVLRSVLALAPDEPQSWRDLGLALARAGQHQAAVDQLWQVVAKPWAGRFPGVELIALAELNAIAAQAQAASTPVNTSAVDPRLLRNLPLSLRAVLAWDADDTDIDLYVLDPNGEEAYFGNRLTYQGGRMSADFTGGYGPEEFSLKNAKPGTYTVRARFYGHRQQVVAPATTLMLRLSTGFGTPAQKDQDVVLRLTGRGDVVTVGSFTIGPRP